VIPLFAQDTLLADLGTTYMFIGIFVYGIALGARLCKSMSRKRLELGLVPFGSLGLTLFALDLYFAGVPELIFTGSQLYADFWMILQSPTGLRLTADFFGLGLFSGFFLGPLYTVLSLRSASHERVSFHLANLTMNALFLFVGSLFLALLLRAEFTPPQVFFVLACMNAAVAMYIYFYMPEFMLRFYAWCLAHVMYRLKVYGHEKIPADGPVVLVCNHVSYVDWLILAAAIKRPTRFVMDHFFYKGWLLRTILNQAKVIPIASAKINPEVLESAFQRMRSELEAGEVVCIFPEGNITSDGDLLPFRPGVERLIKTTPVVVVPMALKNMWGSYFSRKGGMAIKKLPRRFWTAISLEIGDPIRPEDVTAAGLQAAVKDLLDK
jgi:1-acyl-sn-glycerol-3-phosphate acyltransferase